MFLFLLLSAVAHAGPIQDVIDAARVEGVPVLVAGTGTLGGLSGELACVAAEEAEDCGATREPTPARVPLLDFHALEARLVPPLAGRGPSLLLRRRPWGIREPVIPFLGPTQAVAEGTRWVRLDLPDAVVGAEGPVTVRLLAKPTLPEPEGPSPPRPLPFPAGGAAVAWTVPSDGGLGLRIGLPLEVRGVRAEAGGRVVAEAAWLGAPPSLDATPVVEGDAATSIAAGLVPVAGACARASLQLTPSWLSRRRVATGRADARLVLAWDAHGRVLDARVLSPPWKNPDLTTCLEANARLLGAHAPAGALGFLVVPVEPVLLE